MSLIHMNNHDFNESDYDAWIITGSAYSVIDNTQWIIKLKDKIKYATKFYLCSRCLFWSSNN